MLTENALVEVFWEAMTVAFVTVPTTAPLNVPLAEPVLEPLLLELLLELLELQAVSKARALIATSLMFASPRAARGARRDRGTGDARTGMVN
jgi:hypothetical protein